jgi:hypothetical protein
MTNTTNQRDRQTRRATAASGSTTGGGGPFLLAETGPPPRWDKELTSSSIISKPSKFIIVVVVVAVAVAVACSGCRNGENNATRYISAPFVLSSPPGGGGGAGAFYEPLCPNETERGAFPIFVRFSVASGFFCVPSCRMTMTRSNTARRMNRRETICPGGLGRSPQEEV